MPQREQKKHTSRATAIRRNGLAITSAVLLPLMASSAMADVGCNYGRNTFHQPTTGTIPGSPTFSLSGPQKGQNFQTGFSPEGPGTGGTGSCTQDVYSDAACTHLCVEYIYENMDEATCAATTTTFQCAN
jgi:hypothetical protein